MTNTHGKGFHVSSNSCVIADTQRWEVVVSQHPNIVPISISISLKGRERGWGWMKALPKPDMDSCCNAPANQKQRIPRILGSTLRIGRNPSSLSLYIHLSSLPPFSFLIFFPISIITSHQRKKPQNHKLNSKISKK